MRGKDKSLFQLEIAFSATKLLSATPFLLVCIYHDLITISPSINFLEI